MLRRDLPEGELNVSTSQKLIYMPDQLGSVRDVLDGDTGSLVQSYDYTPYGGVARSNGSTPTDYQYAGLFVHPQSGLSIATYRVQDGTTGRWLNRDLIKEIAGLNLYAYVTANPANYTDRLGLTPKDKWFGYKNKDFQKWYHRCWKVEDENEDIGDADKEDLDRAYEEWLSRGSPQNGNCYSNKPIRGKKNCPPEGSPKDIPPNPASPPVPVTPPMPIPSRPKPALPEPFRFPEEFQFFEY